MQHAGFGVARHAWCRVIIDADVNLWLERARASQESLEWEVVHVKGLLRCRVPGVIDRQRRRVVDTHAVTTLSTYFYD